MSTVTIILFSILACVVAFWIRWRKKKLKIFERYGIPAPKPNFLTGNLMEFNEKKEKCLEEWTEKYGKIFGFFLGGKPYIVCYDAELVKIMQIKEYKSFMNRDLLIPDAGIPHRLMLETLILQKDDNWKNARSIISPNFSPGKIKIISNLISDSIKIFLERITKNKDEPIEMHSIYKKLTLDVMCKTAIGIQSNVQEEKDTKFSKSMDTFLEVDSVDILTVISVWFPEFEPIPMYLRRIVSSIKHIMNYPCVNVVMDSCREIINYRKNSGYHQPDLLQLLIDSEDDSSGVKRKLTNDSIIGNAASLLFAGYDTTANTLAWSTYYLAKYAEIQEKVRQEINSNIQNNKEIEHADLSNLKYLDQVISETLRLHTVSVLGINRVSSENYHYKNITLPKNVVVIIPARTLHRDPNYWDEPIKFDPERFSSENAGNIDPSFYQPFGSGPRKCIGMRLAQTVLKLTLANLVRSFKLELHGKSEGEEEYSLFIIRPKNGVNVKMTKIV